MKKNILGTVNRLKQKPKTKNVVVRESFRVKLNSLNPLNRQKVYNQMHRLSSMAQKKDAQNENFSFVELNIGKRIVYKNSVDSVTFVDLVTSRRKTLGTPKKGVIK